MSNNKTISECVSELDQVFSSIIEGPDNQKNLEILQCLIDEACESWIEFISIDTAHVGKYGVCPYTRADTNANPQRVNFAYQPNNDNLLKTFKTFLKNYTIDFRNFAKISQNTFYQNGQFGRHHKKT